MEGSSTHPSQQPWLSVFLILVVALLGFILFGPLIGLFLSMPFFDGTAFDFLTALTDPVGKEGLKVPLFILQGSATLIGLTLVPAFYWYRVTNRSPLNLFRRGFISIRSLVLIFFIVIFFMGFNSIFIDWNAGVDLPVFMDDFEKWARDTEDRATELTKYLTSFGNFSEFAVGFLVIAILPAIGEEFVFRGLLQPELLRATKNIHAAIWISAIFFSALHLQFFGFLPRVLLGALFGYLYYWSGNLAVPMLAHFVNNGFSVIMIYLDQRSIAGMDIEGTEAAPWPVVLIFSLCAAALIYSFRKMHLPNPQAL